MVGLTSNPTIFEKAIDGSNDYAAQIEDDPARRARAAGAPGLRAAGHQGHPGCRPTCCAPTYDRTRGGDGYVSVEVSPGVANDTNATVAEARHLWEVVARPNLMIKVPGTGAGRPGGAAR